jgi:16S rRNA (cytosine967-C5)-methyltransferase
MAKSAREAALLVLERCRRQQAFSDALLSSVMQAAGLDERDRALCARLCYGVLQNQALCDFYINHYAAKAQKLEPKLRDILRLSVYQILFMDKIPVHATVSEGVALCAKSNLDRAKGLANAVLRRIAENRERLPEIPKDDLTTYLSIKYSTPAALVERLLKDFDPDFTEDFLCANNASAPLTVQVNSLKTTVETLRTFLMEKGVAAEQDTLLDNALVLFGAGDLGALPEHRDGLFYVQDTAARLAVLAAAPKAGDKLLDACAAPGGKSFAAALAMCNRGSILSCDLHENKLGRIRGGAERLGISIIDTAAMDAAQPDRSLYEAFDLVLADVPCSGLGVIRKKPDIRYKDVSALAGLPEAQLAILNGLAPCVKPGGALLYSTCTVLRAENEDVADAFLAAHPDFAPEGFTLPAPLGRIESGRLSLYPHIHGTDGFFICKLRKHL